MPSASAPTSRRTARGAVRRRRTSPGRDRPRPAAPIERRPRRLLGPRAVAATASAVLKYAISVGPRTRHVAGRAPGRSPGLDGLAGERDRAGVGRDHDVTAVGHHRHGGSRYTFTPWRTAWVSTASTSATSTRSIEFWDGVVGIPCRVAPRSRTPRKSCCRREVGGSRIQLAQHLDQEGPIDMGTAMWKLYVNTDDCQALYDKAIAAGCESVSPPAARPLAGDGGVHQGPRRLPHRVRAVPRGQAPVTPLTAWRSSGSPRAGSRAAVMAICESARARILACCSVARDGDPEHVVADALEAEVGDLRQRREHDRHGRPLPCAPGTRQRVAALLRRRAGTVVAVGAVRARAPDAGVEHARATGSTGTAATRRPWRRPPAADPRGTR